MFTPTNNNHSSFCFPSSTSSSSSSYSFPHLHHHPSAFENINVYHDHLSSSFPFIPTLIPEAVMTNNLAVASSDYGCVVGKQQNTAPDGNVVSGNFISKKPPSSKKDRHSKIYTSQGLRDRRVRLSIEIARKFFDLQDMLGFDKASNTLDWLFTKSKKAIQELEASAARRNKNKTTTTNNNNNKSLSSSSDEYCEEVVSPQRVEDSDSGGRTRTETVEKAAKREKARARARERANHKGKSSILEEPKETECSVIKRKVMKQACCNDLMNSNHHPQNQLVIPNHHKELASFTTTTNNNTTIINTTSSTSHHDYSIFPNLTPNWDIINGRSNFCALANMNLSTDLQIYGKFWEECNNQRH